MRTQIIKYYCLALTFTFISACKGQNINKLNTIVIFKSNSPLTLVDSFHEINDNNFVLQLTLEKYLTIDIKKTNMMKKYAVDYFFYYRWVWVSVVKRKHY